MCDAASESHDTDRGMLDHLDRVVRTKRRPDATRRWLWCGEREEPTPGYTGLYEAPGSHIGVCCSGGGIRSAAFNLGALQVMLADGRRRKQIKYVSAVSGGAYIASAFWMVAKCRRPGDVNDSDSDPALVDDDSLPFHPGSPEEQYLRDHLGYLAPDASAKVYLALRLLAGLMVNVGLIGLPVLLLGLAVGLAANSPYHRLDRGSFHLPAVPLALIVGAAAIALGLALVDVAWRPRRDAVVQWIHTWEVRTFVLACSLAVLLIVVPGLAALAVSLGGHSSSGSGVLHSVVAAFSSTGALALAAIAHVRGQVKDAQKQFAAAERQFSKYARQVRKALIAVAVTLAGPILLLALAVTGVLVAVGSKGSGVVVFAIAALVLGGMWLLVDLTAVSLHPFYRRRLATAFALRRVWEADPRERSTGRAVARQRPFDDLVRLSHTQLGSDASIESWPALIVCAAANVSDPGATPPGRSVASFTFSAGAVGGPLTGATAATVYEKLGRNRQRDVTLPAAVAMSGAALSPSMGKLTLRPLTFLLALANIRLGVWVPNPRHVNEVHRGEPTREYRRLFPKQGHQLSPWHRPGPVYLWKELFGRNRLDDRFLYVTDGGHYENLGLVELLRRGCGTIYCFDAGAGRANSALGDAIALARSELNVTIEMDPGARDLKERQTPPVRAKASCAKGTITYPGGQTGELYYVCSVVTDESPWDVANYQEDGVFPHDSTFDQFFDDQKFEAYRRLGFCAANGALEIAQPRVPARSNGAGFWRFQAAKA